MYGDCFRRNNKLDEIEHTEQARIARPPLLQCCEPDFSTPDFSVPDSSTPDFSVPDSSSSDFSTPDFSSLAAHDRSPSRKNIDYQNLQNLLQEGRWKEADYETYLVMLQMIDRPTGSWIRPEDFDHFPCLALYRIDRLWFEFSEGRFGFSVQQRVWQEVAEDYQLFGDRVGWRVEDRWLTYDRMTFQISAPQGHLPSGWVKDCNLDSCLSGCSYVGFEDLFDRLNACVA
ncbi:MAG: GUN4 domain-containing protein [Leptolyngbyaceae cyanobacterium CSU_1_3]|nr:GUN4 domain-containing protein [Leptolyngbyaceae cyanobacterium CSU_1_3]